MVILFVIGLVFFGCLAYWLFRAVIATLSLTFDIIEYQTTNSRRNKQKLLKWARQKYGLNLKFKPGITDTDDTYHIIAPQQSVINTKFPDWLNHDRKITEDDYYVFLSDLSLAMHDREHQWQAGWQSLTTNTAIKITAEADVKYFHDQSERLEQIAETNRKIYAQQAQLNEISHQIKEINRRTKL